MDIDYEHFQKFKRDLLIDHLVENIDKRIWDKFNYKVKSFYKSIDYEKKNKMYVDLSYLEFNGNKTTSIKFLLSTKNENYKFDYP